MNSKKHLKAPSSLSFNLKDEDLLITNDALKASLTYFKPLNDLVYSNQ